MRRGRKQGRSRFHGMYWRQLFVTTGMVLLTLALLGILFFSLSYRYADSQNSGEVEARTENYILTFAQQYLKSDTWFRSLPELRQEEEYIRLAAVTRESTGIRILICDTDGRVIPEETEDENEKNPVSLSPEAAASPELVTPELEPAVLTVPEDLTERVKSGSFAAGWCDWKQDGKFYLAGVPAVNSKTGEIVGLVFAASPAPALDNMWHGLAALFFATALVVLLIATMAASVTAMRLATPLRDMVYAARRYAEGDFDQRLEGYDQDDEIGELAAAFNQMADSLQRQEEQRREFISNVSHDLKTPLTTIAGYTDGILDGTIPPAGQRKYLEIISQESRRLSRMVRRMLDVSQLQTIDPLRSGVRFDLCECMRRVLISMEQRIRERGLDVDADIPDESILALGDFDMITQVIYNLLENAVKFARTGSTLYLGVAERDGRARVVVRNVGETIPPEELPLLFDRFHKSDKSRNEDKDGVGLGLYIVKTILEQHKETIHAASENGVTTFSFSLRTDRGDAL